MRRQSLGELERGAHLGDLRLGLLTQPLDNRPVVDAVDADGLERGLGPRGEPARREPAPPPARRAAVAGASARPARAPGAGTPTGSPVNSHVPSSRRCTSSAFPSSLSAVDTVGRRAPTSCPSIRCDSVIGSATPSGVIRPQRSARCQNRASSRRSTRLSCEMACVTASRSARSLRRSMSAALTSGNEASWAANRRSSKPIRLRLSTFQRTEYCSREALSWRCQGRSTSPGPNSSVLIVSETRTSRARTPSSTSRPMWSALVPDRLSTSHGPVSIAWMTTRSSARAGPSRSSLRRRPRSGSSSSSDAT